MILTLDIGSPEAQAVSYAINNFYRVKILNYCSSLPVEQAALSHVLGITSSMVSIHVGILRTAGLLAVTTDRTQRMKNFVKTIYEKIEFIILPPAHHT